MDFRKRKNVQPLKTFEEIENMREALEMTSNPERNLLLFNLGINTGLRISDLIKLRVEDVRGKTSIIVYEGKTQKKRTVYLNMMMAEIAEFLEHLKENEGRETGWLFSSRKGDGHITTTQAYRILRDAGKLCGYDYVGTHTMRKVFGFHYYQRTKDIATLMIIFNHSSQEITKRYLGIDEDQIRESLKEFKI